MPLQLTRREVLPLALVLLVTLPGCTTTGALGAASSVTVPTTAAPATTGSASTAPTTTASVATASVADREFRRLESEFDSQLGIFALDTGTKRSVTYRADQRFAYASTLKAFAVGAVLKRNSDKEIDAVIRYTKDDLVTYSPITEKHVDTGMTLREISDAAIRYSDNTAANLLFRELGGPKGLSAELKKIGDDVTHVDRIETALNEAIPGDIRDTSTPRAFGLDLQKFSLGNALNTKDRALLNDLLRRNTTGASLIRAGVPEGWTVGDKTGSASYGTRNDIAVLWPPKGAPIVLAIMTNRSTQDAKHDDALIAQATTAALNALT